MSARAKPNGTAPLVPLLALALALSTALPVGAQESNVIAREGDPVLGGAGGERVEVFQALSVNDSGRVVIGARTDTSGSVVLDSGAIVLRKGDALPGGATYCSSDDLQTNNAGNLVNTAIIGTGTSSDLGLYFDDILLARRDAPIDDPAVGPGVVYGPIFGARVNDRNEVIAVMFFDDAGVGFVGTALVRYVPDDAANPTSFATEVVAHQGANVPGLDIPTQGVEIDAGSYSLNDEGSVLYVIRAQAPNSVSTAVVLDDTLIARSGRVSPIAGRNYLPFYATELDLNDFGDVVFRAAVDGDPSTNEFLQHNGRVFVQEGDALASVAPHRIQRLDTAPVEISNSGDIYWRGELDDPDFATNQAYFRNHEVILRQGDSLGADVITDIRTANYAFDVSDSGRFFLAGVTLNGTDDALVLADFGAVVPVLGCDTNTAELRLSDGLCLAGNTLRLELDQAQGLGALSILYLSTAAVPISPCGPMGGFGELLIDPGAGSRIARLVGGPYGGAGVPIDVAIPADPALVDRVAYAQGLFLDTTGSEPLRATNALQLEIGAP